MNFLFVKENQFISVTLGEKSPSYLTVKNWVAWFKTGHFSTEDEDHSGRPFVVTVPENVDAMYYLISDQKISAKKISLEHVRFTIHDVLDKTNLSAKWEPRS
jgi:hypothetical protein